jgi:ATP-dependent DNA helicase DinG
LLLQQAAAALLDQCRAPDWAEREGAWTVLDSLARLRWPWAPLLAQAVERPQRAERWLFPACPNGKRCPNAPSPRKCG